MWVDDLGETLELLKASIQLKAFERVTSTELELQTLLWALKSLGKPKTDLFVYTDSQNIVSLIDRRRRLEENGFRNASGASLKQAQLYKGFYQLLDDLKFKVIKVRGHSPSGSKSKIERIFSLLDRRTRRELRWSTAQIGEPYSSNS